MRRIVGLLVGMLLLPVVLYGASAEQRARAFAQGNWGGADLVLDRLEEVKRLSDILPGDGTVFRAVFRTPGRNLVKRIVVVWDGKTVGIGDDATAAEWLTRNFGPVENDAEARELVTAFGDLIGAQDPLPDENVAGLTREGGNWLVEVTFRIDPFLKTERRFSLRVSPAGQMKILAVADRSGSGSQ